MSFDNFNNQEIEPTRYIKIPKRFHTDIAYYDLSVDAIFLYGIMLDRENYAIKNNWLDEDGRRFIYMPIETVEDVLRCGRAKAVGVLKDLEGFGLIEKKRQGLGKPTIIYVKKID